MTHANHIRTLLLNDVKMTPSASRPGEEYVDQAFLPRQLPQQFDRIRRVLFGAAPDRAMLNFRLHQCMQAIHATDLAEYVTYHDTRITYLPFDRVELFNTAFMTLVSSEAATGPLTLLGAPQANETSGKLYHWFRAHVIDADWIHLIQYQPITATEAANYTLTSGTSDIITFPSSDVKFTFTGSPGDMWDVQGVSRPTKNMADILASLVSVVSDADHDVLFGANPQEPMLTFKRTWLTHDFYANRLSALLLAMAFQTHALSET